IHGYIVARTQAAIAVSMRSATKRRSVCAAGVRSDRIRPDEWCCLASPGPPLDRSRNQRGPFGVRELRAREFRGTFQFMVAQGVLAESVAFAERVDHARDDRLARQAGLAAQ